ncbi:EF-hand domain pair domain-containing protein [Ditylenchus destructor]|nr:EF-hand domain pair domain-containing protein [Ditylenchus destructor]
MKAFFAMALVVALALSVFADDEEVTKKFFEEADTDHDGFITYEEILKSKFRFSISREVFDLFDTNKDGKLSFEEAHQRRPH